MGELSRQSDPLAGFPYKIGRDTYDLWREADGWKAARRGDVWGGRARSIAFALIRARPHEAPDGLSDEEFGRRAHAIEKEVRGDG